MSPAAKLLRKIVVELQSKAVTDEISDKIGNKEVGWLANDENETTVGAWLRGESRNRQFTALIALCSYLPVATVAKAFAEVLPKSRIPLSTRSKSINGCGK